MLSPFPWGTVQISQREQRWEAGAYKDRSAGTEGRGRFPGQVQVRGKKVDILPGDKKSGKGDFYANLETEALNKCPGNPGNF